MDIDIFSFFVSFFYFILEHRPFPIFFISICHLIFFLSLYLLYPWYYLSIFSATFLSFLHLSCSLNLYSSFLSVITYLAMCSAQVYFDFTTRCVMSAMLDLLSILSFLTRSFKVCSA